MTKLIGSPPCFKPKLSSPRHIIIKLSEIKDREEILKAGKEKKFLTYKGTPIRLSVDFSAECLQDRRQWDDVFKVVKEKDCQPRILYLAELVFRNEREKKTFSDKPKLGEFITTRAAL